MSRKLDVRVAEAMGWHWDDDWGCLIPPEQKAKPSEMWTDWIDDGNGDKYREPIKCHSVIGIVYSGNFTKIILPEYSSDITVAWRVVEWMRAKGWYFILRWEDAGCSVSFGKPEWDTSDLYQSRTLPTGRSGIVSEAICLAFVAATCLV